MRRVVLMVLTGALMVSCNQSANKEGAENQETEKVKIVTATVEEMLAQPSEYDGKEVAVSGMVTHVCRHGGQKCFIVGADGETQIRIVPGGDIDEFKIDMEGSTVAFKGTFKVSEVLTQEYDEEHEAEVEGGMEMAHADAEKADYFVEATDFKEITQ